MLPKLNFMKDYSTSIVIIIKIQINYKKRFKMEAVKLKPQKMCTR